MEEANAYVAGLLDGEGCIHLGVRKGTFRARVTVGMTSPALPLLTELRGLWGGSIYQLRPSTQSWASAWTWSIQGEPARQLLQAVLPYLRLKRRQAELCLEVETIRASLVRRPNGGGAWTAEARAACEAIKAELHSLNAKGPRVSPATGAEVA